MVSLKSVIKRFTPVSAQAESTPVNVLDQISLDLAKGDFLYIVGGSGAGKTTLLKLMATEDQASAGSVSLFGYDLSRISANTLTAIRRSIGYIPQGVRLIPDLSVLDNVLLSIDFAGGRILKSSAKGKLLEILEALNLADKRNKLARTLSGGEAQRVAVARAIARSPELIVADEPTGSQDQNHTWGLMNLLVKLNQASTTVVIATHDRDIVRRVRKNCALLSQGRLVMEDSPLWLF